MSLELTVEHPNLERHVAQGSNTNVTHDEDENQVKSISMCKG